MSDEGNHDLSSAGSAGSVLPLKRKRGRPRKHPLAAPSATGAVAVAIPPGLQVQAAGTAVVVKRGPGRPRKNPLPEPAVRAGPPGLQSLEPCAGTGVVGQVSVPAKRRPGRPRKVPLAGQTALVLQDTPDWQTAPERLRNAAAAQAPEIAQAAEPVMRKRGRPRKNPVEPAAGGREPGNAVKATAGNVSGDGNGSISGVALEEVDGGKSEKPGEPGPAVDRFGIGPANEDGIGFWPPKPEEVEAVKVAARAAGVIRRGRRPKAPAPEGTAGTAESPRDGTDGSFGPEGGAARPEGSDPMQRPVERPRPSPEAIGKPFCGKCGTYTRLIQPERGPARRVCPKCHPEKVPLRRSPLDRTGKPCQDRGVCRPERCVMAFECEEMKRGR